MIRRTDLNHKKIIYQCRKIPHLSVFSCHELGKGFPDIAVGYKGKNYLFEIKNEDKPPSQRKLTAAEQEFFNNWQGQVNVVHNIEEVLEILHNKK